MSVATVIFLSGSASSTMGQDPLGVAPIPGQSGPEQAAPGQAGYQDTTTQAATQAADVRAMIERMDRMDREVQSLRSQLEQERQIKAQPAANTAGGMLADAAASQPAAPQDAGGALKEIEIISKPTVTVFGRMFFDHIMYEDDPPLVAATGVDRLNETGFDTIRIGAKGNAYENVLYQVEVEFEGTETDFKDCYIEANNAPYLGNVRVGHFRENFSLEETTSSRFITWMERSIAHSALVPSRSFGLMAYDEFPENDNWSWFAGAYRHDSPDNPAARGSHIADEGDWCFTGRLAGLLYYDEPSQGRYLVHVGGAYSARNDLTVVSFASRPELGSQLGYLTSTFTGDDTWDLYGAEFAVVWGVQSVQAEYYLADVDGGEADGGYFEYSYFITGENRGYQKHMKCFDRVRPIEDFFRVSTADGICMGRGAWQLKARYSWLDMNDGVAGVRGYQDDFSAGANWYWNPYTRMMFDYVYEDVSLLSGVQGSNNNFGMRFQIDY
jgi:phosphate-selective porin OprO/OprP